MELSISTKNGEIPESVQKTIEQKVRKLPKFFDRTTGIEVLIDLVNGQEPRAEIKVSAEETDDFFANDTGGNVITAVEKVVEKLERQLRKHKEKITNHRAKPAAQTEADSDD